MLMFFRIFRVRNVIFTNFWIFPLFIFVHSFMKQSLILGCSAVVSDLIISQKEALKWNLMVKNGEHFVEVVVD